MRTEVEDVARDISGETVCGFRVAAYRETHPEHGDKHGHRYSEHWSTPSSRPDVKVERLFTEDQLRAALRAQAEQVRVLEGALEKVNAIRNSIIGCQRVNFSEHVYPLVAALNEAGFTGQDYAEARENVGTMLERTLAAEARAEAAERRAGELEGALHWYGEQAANCRKITSDGDTARRALDRDGGAKARALLPATQAENPQEHDDE